MEKRIGIGSSIRVKYRNTGMALMAIRPTPSYPRSTMPDWLKWTLIVSGLILVLVLIYLSYLYYAIQQNKTSGFDKTEAAVLNETDITEVEEISRFQDDTAYDIVLGTTKDQKQQYVFVPKQKGNKDFTAIDAAKTVSKQQIINQWKKQCDQCKLVRLTPAMIDEKPLWEMTYWNKSDRYIMDYISMYDGKRYQQFRFKSMFH